MNPRVKHVSARVRPKRRKSNKLEKSEKIASKINREKMIRKLMKMIGQAIPKGGKNEEQE